MNNENMTIYIYNEGITHSGGKVHDRSVLVKKDMLRYVQEMKAEKEWDEAFQTTMLYCVRSG